MFIIDIIRTSFTEERELLSLHVGTGFHWRPGQGRVAGGFHLVAVFQGLAECLTSGGTNYLLPVKYSLAVSLVI